MEIWLSRVHLLCWTRPFSIRLPINDTLLIMLIEIQVKNHNKLLGTAYCYETWQVNNRSGNQNILVGAIDVFAFQSWSKCDMMTFLTTCNKTCILSSIRIVLDNAYEKDNWNNRRRVFFCCPVYRFILKPILILPDKFKFHCQVWKYSL